MWILIIDCMEYCKGSFERNQMLEVSAHFTLFSLSDISLQGKTSITFERGRLAVRRILIYVSFLSQKNVALLPWFEFLIIYSDINFSEHHRVWFKLKDLEGYIHLLEKFLKNYFCLTRRGNVMYNVCVETLKEESTFVTPRWFSSSFSSLSWQFVMKAVLYEFI